MDRAGVVLGNLDNFPPAFPLRKTGRELLTMSGLEKGAGFERFPGRFGWLKGDGLLDFGVPYFGVIWKRCVLKGHSRLMGKKDLWALYILPSGSWARVRRPQRYPGLVSKDEVKNVNWVCCTWEKKVVVGRRAYRFRLTYSLPTPALLLETGYPMLTIRGFRFKERGWWLIPEPAGECNLGLLTDYRFVVLPLRGKAVLRETKAEVYNRRMDERLSENWVFLFGARGFPDIPLLLVLKRNPERIVFERDKEGLLKEIRVEVPGGLGFALIMTPFGIETFEPLEQEKWLKGAI